MTVVPVVPVLPVVTVVILVTLMPLVTVLPVVTVMRVVAEVKEVTFVIVMKTGLVRPVGTVVTFQPSFFHNTAGLPTLLYSR